MKKQIATVAVLLAMMYGVYAEDGWPTKPVTIVIPSPPGGSSDLTVRAFAEPLAQEFGQQFLVESKPGGGGNIANQAVAQAAPDGYTFIMITAATHGVGPSLYKKLTYDPIGDFQFVGRFVSIPNVIVVGKDSKYQKLADLVADAKARPGKLSFGSLGQGTTTHLTGTAFAKLASVDVVHVGYKGGAPMVTGILSGEIDYGLDQLAGSIGQITSGQLRALAVTSANRLPQLPDVPTVAELGMGTFDFATWYGIAAPKGTPAPVVEKFSAALKETLGQQKVVDTYLRLGSQPAYLAPAEFRDYAVAEIAKWKPIVQATGLQLD